jgi:WhiB family redox-sensing transcriptional regulator
VNQRLAVHESSLEALMRALADDPATAWQRDALCAQTDPEAFFPEKGASVRAAKNTCLACPVRTDCLEFALARDERHGVWGGLSERERRRIKKSRTRRPLTTTKEVAA